MLRFRLSPALNRGIAGAGLGRRRTGPETRTPALGEWLAQYASARTLGSAGPSSAAANDPLGVMWNPAGGPDGSGPGELRDRALFEDTSINSFGSPCPEPAAVLRTQVLALRSR